ncbi:MAG: glycosyl hydrolase [Alistipes indistinctus]
MGSGTSISRMPGSAAHFHGKARVGAESRYRRSGRRTLAAGSGTTQNLRGPAWIHGVTQLVMHSYVHQPYLNVRPGWTLAQHGSHLSRANTWWPYGNGWVDYHQPVAIPASAGHADSGPASALRRIGPE